MIIIGMFEQSIELEQVLTILENSSISKNQILVIFMDDMPSPIQIPGRTQNIHSNAFEIGMASATGCAVIGASVGFKLYLGPIICGLLGAIIGFAIGYALYFFPNKNKPRSKKVKKSAEVAVIIQCTKSQLSCIEDTLWKYKAISVGKSD
ncbi:hypothetical protein [Cytobacillus massiliigabonensis]|uniref:hypothetical protein n=1 Tax=Cytobacillus massiliigabonensis TaxID=1871011 RepID=UPI000C850B73|nr:hypothetical protein [Cytobacillus massiliigabonensis]